MRKFAMTVLAFFSAQVFATVDGHDRLFLVVEDIQSGEFFLERAPMIACYGLPQGARLSQWVAEYKVPTNIGCGGTPVLENINALTCAQVVAAKESPDDLSFSDITLDISKCAHKNNAKFITMIRTSAARNFPQSHNQGEVHLKLIR